jgi:coenzyme F420-reducing hydrogenase delta subunit/ferredoxin
LNQIKEGFARTLDHPARRLEPLSAIVELPQRRPASAEVVRAIDRAFDAAFGERGNPLRQLGALGYLIFWIVAATGAYLYVFFDTSLAGAWSSVDAIDHQALRSGALMRGLHRYASDALVVVSVLHLAREAALGRFTGFRWFTWLTGVPLLGLIFAVGFVGFWLIWDQLAAYVAYATLEWLAALPGIGAAVVRNAVVPESVTDRTFSLLIFLHIGLSLLMLLGMWIHVQRLTRAETVPRRAAAIGLGAVLVALVWLRPVPLLAPADLSRLPSTLELDWIYLGLLPAGARAPIQTWVLVALALGLLCAMPWLGRTRRSAPARVDNANCNGCGRCFEDCPYGAVTMVPRSDGRSHRTQAVVAADLCASCGICAGSCPSATPFRSGERLISGIDVPALAVDALRGQLMAALSALSGPVRTLVFECRHAVPLARPDGVGVVGTLCSGQLPPAFVEYALRHGADAVVVNSCTQGDCLYRLGAGWTRARLEGTREPRLREAVSPDRVLLLESAVGDARGVAERFEAFRRAIGPAGDGTATPPRRAGHA